MDEKDQLKVQTFIMHGSFALLVDDKTNDVYKIERYGGDGWASYLVLNHVTEIK